MTARNVVLAVGASALLVIANGFEGLGAVDPEVQMIDAPACNSGGCFPGGVAAGPDGAVWYTAYQSKKIGRITFTDTGGTEHQEFGLTQEGPFLITPGPDGNMWFTEPEADIIGKITPEGHVTEYSSGITIGSTPWGITTGTDGNIWFTERETGDIGRITPDGAVTEFPNDCLPIGVSDSDALSFQITSRGDDLWFTCSRKYGRLNRVTGAKTMFNSPFGLWGITTGPDNNIWAASHQRRILKINPNNGNFTEIILGNQNGNTNRNVAFIASGPDENLWFTEIYPAKSAVGRMTTSGEELPQFFLPDHHLRGIWAGPDGNIWFANSGEQKLGRIILPGPTVSALNPNAGPTAGGTTVEISGSGIAPAMRVSFGDQSVACGTSTPDCIRQPGTPAPGDDKLIVKTPSHRADPTLATKVITPGRITQGPTFNYRPPVITQITGPDLGSTILQGPATGGTPITLTGTDLQASSVKFAQTGAKQADTTINIEGTQILTKTPPSNPGAVDVTATPPPGDIATAPKQFTFLPTITAISPPSGKPEGGEQVTIFGKGFLGATTITFGNEPPISIPASTKDDEITARTPPHNVVEAVPVTISGYLDGPAAGLSSIAAQLGSNLFTYKQGFARGSGFPNNPAGLSSQDSGVQPTSTSTGGGTGGSTAFNPSAGNLFGPGSGFVSNVSVNSVPGAGFAQSTVGGQGLAPGAANTTTGPPSTLSSKSGVPTDSLMPITRPGQQGANAAAAGVVQLIPEPAPKYLMSADRTAKVGLPKVSFIWGAWVMAIAFLCLLFGSWKAKHQTLCAYASNGPTGLPRSFYS